MLVHSARLYLREATLEDAEVFFQMDSDPEVMRHIGDGGPTTDPEVTRAGLGRVIAGYSRRPGFGLWPCCLLDSHRCVGWLALKPCSLSADAPAPGETAPLIAEPIELGYRLLRSEWGHGYATEMAIEVLQYGFAQVGVERIIAACKAENIASARVMMKAGLAYAGRGQYAAVPVDVYAASKDAWRRPASERHSP